MHRKKNSRSTKILIAAGLLLLAVFPVFVAAAQVTLQWDANVPPPEKYRVYQRQDGTPFDYSAPRWSGAETLCTIDSLTPGVTYYFVVRAFESGAESGDSNQVYYTPPVSDDTDTAGGTGADADSDGDGMPDAWEIENGLDPFVDDANADMDGDGISNIDEYKANTDHAQIPANRSPAKPTLSHPSDGAIAVDLTPVLMTGAFEDADSDAHAQTCYQISLTSDFSELIYQRTFSQHLTTLQVPELLLEPETTYFWRVQHFDNRNAASDWSDAFQFITIDDPYVRDLDLNGVPDWQDVNAGLDLDQDGMDDVLQAGLYGVNTDDTINPQVALKVNSSNVDVGIMMALDASYIPYAANQPEYLTGVIGFKLYLQNEDATAEVKVYFSQPAPSNAQWYKYDMDEGWTVYDNAVFSADRRSITLMLEDGGIGDQDGVRNGIIVDPSGLGYSSQLGATSSGSAASGAGCFIDTASHTRHGRSAGVVAILLLFGTGALLAIIAMLRLRHPMWNR
jgi:hypothetical protein